MLWIRQRSETRKGDCQRPLARSFSNRALARRCPLKSYTIAPGDPGFVLPGTRTGEAFEGEPFSFDHCLRSNASPLR